MSVIYEMGQFNQIPLIEDANKEYEVEKIVKERIVQKKNLRTRKIEPVLEYLVQWVGYKQRTWEPIENLENCKEALGEFLLKQNSHINNKRKIKTYLKKKTTKQKIKRKKNNNNLNNITINKNIFKVTGKISNINNNGNINTNEKNNLNNKLKKYKKNKDKIKYNKSIDGNSPNQIEKNKTINNENEDKKDINKNDNENENEKEKEKEKDNINNNIGEKNAKENDNIIKTNLNIGQKENNDSREIINNLNFNENNNNNIIDNNYNFLNEDAISFGQFINAFDCDDPLKNNILGIQDKNVDDENGKILEKKFNEEKCLYEDNNKSKLQVLEINSLKIPKNIKEKFIINITYKNKHDNKIYTRDFETTNKEIPRECLIKYYEHIFFEKNKGQVLTKKLIV